MLAAVARNLRWLVERRMNRTVKSERKNPDSELLTKRSKRTLLLSPFFFPEMISTGRYNTYLAKAMVARGADVDIVASHPLYPDWKPRGAHEQLEGMRIHRGGVWMRYPRKDALRRLLLEIWFAFHSLSVCLRRRRDLDVVVFVFPPVLFSFILKVVIPKRVRVVGIVHDLQGLMMSSGIVGGKRILGRIMLAGEGYSLRMCDEVICLSRSMADVVVRQLGVCNERCKVFYPFAVWEPGDTGGYLADIFEEGRIHVVYAGALGHKQIPSFLLKVFEALCGFRKDVVCHIFSRGPIFDRLVRQRDGAAADRIRFHDLVPERALGELYRRSGIQVIPQASGTGAAAFPSKLPNLLAAGVPVFSICAQGSELMQVTRECGGAASTPDDASSVAKDISEYVDEVAGETHEQRKARSTANLEKMFSVDGLVDVILGEDRWGNNSKRGT